MRKISWWIISVGTTCIATRLCSYAMPEFLSIFLSLLLFLLLLVLLFVAVRKGFVIWRQVNRFWITPSLVCVLFISCFYFASPMGQLISNWQFSRHIAEYSRFVEAFENRAISCQAPCNAELQRIEATDKNVRISRPPHIRQVMGARCNDAGTMLLFLVDTDVPLLHEGYLFKGYGENSNCNNGSVKPEKRWEIRHITGNWYHFSDQPGL